MRQFIFSLLLFCTVPALSYAQPVFTPRNLALGGGGSTYITDYNANFYNPANLMIQEQEGTFSFGVGITGAYLDAVLNYNSPGDQLNNAKNYINIYKPGNTGISEMQRTEILEHNYPGKTTQSDNRLRFDATLIGMKWIRENKAFSVALRTRTSSSIRVGQGWYTDSFKNITDDTDILDRSLTHRYQSLHEISFGYAESFQFLTRLTPRIDNFIIGIAPKLVIGTGYQNAEWNNVYEQDTQTNTINRIQKFSYNATGEFGASTIAYLNGTPINDANAQSFSSNPFNVNGIGAGLDIGVTYLITLGSDLSAVRRNQQPTERSLRLSFSMTDIGFISYNNDEISLSFPSDTTTGVLAPSQTSDEAFMGGKGQYIDFIQKFGEDNPFIGTPNNRSAFATLLPIALHGGALLEINRFKLMGDVSIGLTNNAFNSTKLISSFGMELRPFSFLPLRGGVQFEAQRPDFISIGTGIETRKWDLSLAAIFTPTSLVEQPTITGAAVAALQFHF